MYIYIYRVKKTLTHHSGLNYSGNCRDIPFFSRAKKIKQNCHKFIFNKRISV